MDHPNWTSKTERTAIWTIWTNSSRGLKDTTKHYFHLENNQNACNHFEAMSKELWFWCILALFEWSRIFSGKTAVYVSCLHCAEQSCKKAKKPLEPSLRKSAHQATDTNQTSIIRTVLQNYCRMSKIRAFPWWVVSYIRCTSKKWLVLEVFVQ